MCGGGKFGFLFKNPGISGLGKNLRDYVEKQKAESSPEAQQTKDDNAAQAVRKKKRLSEVLSSNESKKSTLGG